MSVFRNTLLDVVKSVTPIMLIVYFVHFFIVKMPTVLVQRFTLGSFVIILGLGLFLFGVDLSITEIGKYMGTFSGKRKTILGVLFTGLFFGFIIAAAEPDVLILAGEIAGVSGGSLSSLVVIVAIALGVGTLIGLGFVRIIKGFPAHLFFGLFYGFYLILLIFVPESFQAIAYDASGASTGAITSPFFLALALGIASLKGSVSGEEDSFGMVGIASMGPILCMLLLSFFIKLDISGAPAPSMASGGTVLGPFIGGLLPTAKEAATAMLPLIIVFGVLNASSFKIAGKELKRIVLGLIYSFLGLIGFLLGVTSGFMDLGASLGENLAQLPNGTYMLPIIGLILGLVIVLAEPSVFILANSIEQVTAGSIQRKFILVALCLGVGFAVAISMIRVQVPALRFWMIIAPGFILTIILSFFVDPIFVGISYDAGGVASGPMTATFIVAVLQGAARIIPTADPMLDGFGVLATVAMMPIFSVMLLGFIYKMSRDRGLEV